MDENILTCLITCITQLITTLITVGVTIFVAYRTYCSQKRRNDNESRRLQFVNCNSSLELFRAYIANLIIFSYPSEAQLELKDLLTCIEKMKLIEEYLSELTEVNLPDTFVEDFRLYRIKIAFQRISIEQRLNGISGNSIKASIFDDLDTIELINSVEKFISSYHNQKPDEK